MQQPKPHSTATHKPSKALVWIGLFKLSKAALLVIVGVGALKLLHQDVAEVLAGFVVDLRLDPGNRYFNAAIERLGLLDDHALKEIGVGSFVYASLLCLEGVGLCLRKRWAEYLTVIMTASLLPLEIWELSKRVTAVRVGVLVVNLAILVYLIVTLRRDRTEHAARVETH